MSIDVCIVQKNCFSKGGQSVPDIADSHSSDHLRERGEKKTLTLETHSQISHIDSSVTSRHVATVNLVFGIPFLVVPSQWSSNISVM